MLYIYILCESEFTNSSTLFWGMTLIFKKWDIRKNEDWMEIVRKKRRENEMIWGIQMPSLLMLPKFWAKLNLVFMHRTQNLTYRLISTEKWWILFDIFWIGLCSSSYFATPPSQPAPWNSILLSYYWIIWKSGLRVRGGGVEGSHTKA